MEDQGEHAAPSGVFGGDDTTKIFVGGLGWETTQDELRGYFEKFGTVTDCLIKTDPTTGRPRGFGFVLFAESSAVDRVINEGPHTLSGKTINPKRAKPLGPEPVKKVFVGGLDPNTPEEQVREYFEKFGTIEELILPMDKMTNTRKSFAFVTFEKPETVDEICQTPMHNIGDKSVEVKKATDKPGLGGRGGPRGGPRGRGNRGGGRGGYDYGYGGGWNANGGGGGYGAYGAYGGYDYYGGYGADPYAQQYGTAPQQGGNFRGGRGGGGRGGPPNNGSTDTRYQPYSR